MDLFEEMNNNQATGKKKNNNTLKIIIAIISVLVVAIIAIIGTILYLKSTTMKLTRMVFAKLHVPSTPMWPQCMAGKLYRTTSFR